MRREKHWVFGRLARRGGILALLYGLTPRPTAAQTLDFALNRPNLSAAGDQFAAVGEPNSLLSSQVTALQLTSHYARELVESYSALEDAWTTIVREQWLAHVQARLALPPLPRLAILVDLPVVVANEGDSVEASPQYGAPRGSGLGDARLGLRMGLGQSDAVNTAAELEWGLPTARRGSYLGSDHGHGALRLHGDWSDERVRVVVSLWGRRDFPEEPILGAEVGARAGVGFTHLAWNGGLEALGWVSPASERSRSSAHIEVWGHASYRVSALSFRLAAGPGFALGPGTPAWRALASLGYSWDMAPPPTRIVGSRPIPVRASSERAAQRLHWQVMSSLEATPGERPVPQTLTATDVSPSHPSSADTPLVRQDDCLEAGSACREMVVGELVALPHAVLFGTGRDVLPIDVEKSLGAAAELLNAHPDLVRIAIEGHTDDVGAEADNLALSRRRAVAVMRWLVSHGVDERRLQVRAFGPRYPRFDNSSEEGRSKNRRVEFTVVERDARGRDAWHVGPVPAAVGEALP